MKEKEQPHLLVKSEGLKKKKKKDNQKTQNAIGQKRGKRKKGKTYNETKKGKKRLTSSTY